MHAMTIGHIVDESYHVHMALVVGSRPGERERGGVFPWDEEAKDVKERIRQWMRCDAM
jgi:hypothetical protein